MLPPASNVLYIADAWSNSLNAAPVFSYELQCVKGPDETYHLGGGNVPMSKDQWNRWPADADDEKYITDAVLLNLGLSRA